MTTKHLLLTTALLSTTAVWARSSDPLQLLQGSVQTRTGNSSWQPAVSLGGGQWSKSSATGATVRVGGATVRVAPNTVFSVSASASGPLAIQAKSGKLFVRLANHAAADVKVGSSHVAATDGSFVVDGQGLTLIEGNAHAIKGIDRSHALVGLEGPDSRTRPRTDVQPARTAPTSAGEEEPAPASETAPAPAAETVPAPAAAPASVAPASTTAAPVTSTAPVAASGGGLSGLDLLLIGLGVVGGSFGAAQLVVGGEETNNDIFVPTTF